MPPETGKKSLSPASKPTVRTPSPKGSASKVRRLKETSPKDRRSDRTRWVEVLNCCTAWIPLRKDPHGPEAHGSRKDLRPLATTVPRRTEHPTKLAASVCPHRRHLNPLPQKPLQGATAWLPSHPRSGTARKDPQANAAMMALRSHHYENIDILQHPSEENLPQPGLAGPRVPRPNAAVPACPAVKSAQSRMLRAKRGAYGQQKTDRRMAPPCRGCKPRSPVPFTLHP